MSLHPAMLGLLFFFTFFLMIAAWTYRPGGRLTYRQDANIPLEEDGHDQH